VHADKITPPVIATVSIPVIAIASIPVTLDDRILYLTKTGHRKLNEYTWPQ
jgi:hypothetical protein